MKRAYLFIDGNNFYARQYQLLGSVMYLNFLEFIKQVQKKLKVVAFPRLDKFDAFYLFSGSVSCAHPRLVTSFITYVYLLVN